MAKGLYINRSQLEEVIKTNYKLKNISLINESQGFYRYFIEKEGKEFLLNVYYLKNGRTTVISNCNNGQELEQTIINSIEYKDVRSGSFSTNISEDYFNSLIDFLKNLPNVNVSPIEDKGTNGLICRIKTDFGDSVTLTYFKSTSRMLYQGLLMKLYAIIKSYLMPLGNTITHTETGERVLELNVQRQLEINFPRGFNYLEPTVQGLVRDSYTLVEANTKLSDYGALVMPIMRVLEYRIKKICLDYGVIIDDTKGFRYYKNSSELDWIFVLDRQTNTVTGVNPNIVQMPQDAKDIIVECYDFLRKNRHEMFHANQILAGIKLVETRELALQLIIETSEKIEKSLTYNLSTT